MNNRPLPLQTLRAFEAAARTLSFTVAAQELNLSQSAISQQIKLLEDSLNTPLFIRLTRKLELTSEGLYLAAKVTQSISQLDLCASELINREEKDSLIIVATPSINSQWLISKLPHFRKSFPHINLSVFEGNSAIDMKRYNADIGLFYGQENWLEYDVLELHKDVLFPVCCPNLMALKNLTIPADIQSCQLLGDADLDYNHWNEWLKLANLEPILSSREISFDNMSHMISAAKQGQGIALVRSLLVAQELSEASLIKLFDIEYTPDFATFLVKNNHPNNKQQVTLFEHWIASCL